MPGHSDFLDQQMIQNAFDGMISRAQRCIQAQTLPEIWDKMATDMRTLTQYGDQILL